MGYDWDNIELNVSYYENTNDLLKDIDYYLSKQKTNVILDFEDNFSNTRDYPFEIFDNMLNSLSFKGIEKRLLIHIFLNSWYRKREKAVSNLHLAASVAEILYKDKFGDKAEFNIYLKPVDDEPVLIEESFSIWGNDYLKIDKRFYSPLVVGSLYCSKFEYEIDVTSFSDNFCPLSSGRGYYYAAVHNKTERDFYRLLLMTVRILIDFKNKR